MARISAVPIREMQPGDRGWIQRGHFQMNDSQDDAALVLPGAMVLEERPGGPYLADEDFFAHHLGRDYRFIERLEDYHRSILPLPRPDRFRRSRFRELMAIGPHLTAVVVKIIEVDRESFQRYLEGKIKWMDDDYAQERRRDLDRHEVQRRLERDPEAICGRIVNDMSSCAESIYTRCKLPLRHRLEGSRCDDGVRFISAA